MMTEIGKLQAVRALDLPAGLFADVAPKVLLGVTGCLLDRPARHSVSKWPLSTVPTATLSAG